MKQKTSRWIQRTHVFKRDEFICQACGYRGYKASKTCPGCGRKMKGSSYDASWVDEMEALDAIFDDD